MQANGDSRNLKLRKKKIRTVSGSPSRLQHTHFLVQNSVFSVFSWSRSYPLLSSSQLFDYSFSLLLNFGSHLSIFIFVFLLSLFLFLCFCFQETCNGLDSQLVTGEFSTSNVGFHQCVKGFFLLFFFFFFSKNMFFAFSFTFIWLSFTLAITSTCGFNLLISLFFSRLFDCWENCVKDKVFSPAFLWKQTDH